MPNDWINFVVEMGIDTAYAGLQQASTGIFNDSFPPIYDGVTLTVMNYVRVLAQHGHHPCVVTPWNPEKVEVDYPVMKYFSLPIHSRRPYRYGYPKLDPRIWRRLRNTPFRLVHSHSPFSAGRLAVYAAHKQRIPLVGTFHSKYKSDLQHSFRRTPWMVDIIMKRILAFFNACDHVWIPQGAVESTVREYGFEGKVTVVENGNDLTSKYSDDEIPVLKAEARRKYGIPDDAVSLLFVGQHIREKGIEIIAGTLHRLDGKTPFVMNFIGTGYALDDLRQYVRSLGIADKVFIHGGITDRDELCMRYAAADLFLFPSLYDNAPLVVKEAAAMQTPSILVEGSTASEIIRDGDNGFLTRRSPAEYADLIMSLHDNRDLIAMAGRNARKTLTRTWDDVVQEVMTRYDEIIARYNVEHKYK